LIGGAGNEKFRFCFVLVVTDTTVLLRGYDSSPGNYVVFYLTLYVPLSLSKERGKNF
jgi:hypothetical protein